MARFSSTYGLANLLVLMTMKFRIEKKKKKNKVKLSRNIARSRFPWVHTELYEAPRLCKCCLT